MGMFSDIVTTVACPFCGQMGAFCIQFKFGMLALQHYKIGDEIEWHDNMHDLTGRDAHLVNVRGCGEQCPSCKEEFIDFRIVVRGNMIEQIDDVGGQDAMYIHDNQFTIVE